jgi:hypothetical protein
MGLTTGDKLLVELQQGAKLEGRKPGPFMATKYVLMRRTWDDSLGRHVHRDDTKYTITGRTIETLVKAGHLDASAVIETFTRNATNYPVAITPSGEERARSLDLTTQEVARA